MAHLEKQLLVKTSTLPGAGKGLFTSKDIAKGDRIVEYKGKITSWKEAAHEDNGYIFYATRNHVIDARHFPKHLARYANDARGIGRVKGKINNAEYVKKEGKVFIEATKNIPAGSEIFVSYGPEYWQAIRHNIRLEKQHAARQKKAEV
ncbi:MAG: SET domain-containing protein-lysine N-methyltransferase [Filimonas sp.]|nr:SET domain-containing protein-lysine N-methyltransferase [Filimonas sp.]